MERPIDVTVFNASSAPDLTFVQIDPSGTITYADRAFGRFLGLNKAVGRRFRDLLSMGSRRRWDDIRQSCNQSAATVEEMQFFNRKTAVIRFSGISDGAVCIHGEILSFGRPVGLSNDVSRHTISDGEEPEDIIEEIPPKILRARLRVLQARLASMEKGLTYDPATGLFKREFFNSEVEAQLARLRVDQSSCLLAIISVNGSWPIGDALGSSLRLQILRHLSRRIRACGDVLCAARVGEEKFAVLVNTKNADLQTVTAAIPDLIMRLTSPIEKGGGTWRMNAAVGIALRRSDQSETYDLYQCAAIALRQARRAGEKFVIFDNELAARSRRARILESDLRVAIHENLLYPVYQPIVSVRSEGRIRVEVLARWTHYEYGNVTPDEFIEIAAHAGLTSKLDLSIAAVACEELKPLFLSGQIEHATFNMSHLDLRDLSHIRQFLQIVKSSGIQTTNICIEITEQHFVGNWEAVRQSLTYLKSEGVSIVIDDYGTGYSNLKALIDLPIDAIKVDKSLTCNVVEDRKAALAVLSVTSLARLMGLRLAAEGVETPAQAAVLTALGCQFMQGYLYAKPMRVAELGDWLRYRQNSDARKVAHLGAGKHYSPRSRKQRVRGERQEIANASVDHRR